MSRAVFDAPMIVPDGVLIGEMLSETSTRLPSLRNAQRFVVLDRFAPADPAQDVMHLRRPLGRHDKIDILARPLPPRA